ncbi:MFS transporter [Pseudorhodobacter sp. E13]|uniref:MFS transporter n=1 Tax=Pseudorhodobacter sp. E13 TaxID=2487931 RepID=UPI000F8DF90E|nr:MFS transporter [Pseudorhodobacter sp. E13]RUS59099.1 MFS transporter [Pseudorhodobacter sp. E13]
MRGASPLVIVLILWGAGLGAAAQFGKISILFDRIAAHYAGAGDVTVGLIVSVVGFVGLIFGTTAGLLVQRLGYRRVLLWALAAGAALSAVQALFPPLPVLLALRVVEGFSHLAIVVAAPVMIAQTASLRYQGLAMTLWSSFFGLSFALTAALGLPLARAYGDGALFLAHAAYMLVFAGFIWLALPKDSPQETSFPRLSSLVAQHGVIYRSPRLSAPAMGFFCYTLTYVALLTLLPPMIGGPHQALIATAMPLVSIAVSLSLGVWLLSQAPAVRIVQAGFAVAAGATLWLWAVWGQGWPVVAAALTLAASLGVVQGASFAAIAQLNPTADGRARAAGAIAQLGNLGTTSGTPLLAALIAGQGVAGMALFVLIPSLAGIALHQYQAHRRRILPN